MPDPVFIHPAEARRMFTEYASGEITNENLARGALLIALEEYPQLDVGAYIARLDDLAARIERRCLPGEPSVFRLGHLHAEMFDADGYQGNVADYYDPRNAFLNDVIDRKVGLPITLSIVFVHVATKIGLKAFGMGLPGHYVVKVQFDLNEIYVDVFNQGQTLTLGDIGQIVLTAYGHEVKLSSEHLRAWNGRETLARVLLNVEGMWNRKGEGKKAQAARERIEILNANGGRRGACGMGHGCSAVCAFVAADGVSHSCPMPHAPCLQITV